MPTRIFYDYTLESSSKHFQSTMKVHLEVMFSAYLNTKIHQIFNCCILMLVVMTVLLSLSVNNIKDICQYEHLLQKKSSISVLRQQLISNVKHLYLILLEETLTGIKKRRYSNH